MPRSRGLRRPTGFCSASRRTPSCRYGHSIQEKKATPFGEVHSSYPTGAMFSPDGRWVAYVVRNGQDDDLRRVIPIYRKPASAFSERVRRSACSRLVTGRKGIVLRAEAGRTRGGRRHHGAAVWLRESRGGAATAASLFRTSQLATLYDITPRWEFVVIVGAGRTAPGILPPQIQVVLNWTEELKRAFHD